MIFDVFLQSYVRLNYRQFFIVIGANYALRFFVLFVPCLSYVLFATVMYRMERTCRKIDFNLEFQGQKKFFFFYTVLYLSRR